MRKQGESIADKFRDMDNRRTVKKRKAYLHAAATIPAVYPHSGATDSVPYTPESEQQVAYPHSSLPARGVSQLAAKVTGAVLPMTNMPLLDVSLRPSEVSQLSEDDKTIYLQSSKLIQDEAFYELTRSNLRQALNLHIKRLIIIGDDCLQQDGMTFTNHRLDNYVVQRDVNGNVVYGIVRQWLQEAELPSAIAEQVKLDSAGVVKRQDGDLYPLFTELAYDKDRGVWDTVQFISSTQVPDSDITYDTGKFPFYFSRWNFDPQDNYGTSLVDENYGDILTATAVRQALLDGYSIATMGYIGVRTGSLTPAMVDEAPNFAVLPYDEDRSIVFTQPENIAALTAAETMDQRISTEIRRIFMQDVSAELTHDRTTATQIIKAAEELNRATGGLLSSFDRTTMRPILMSTINYLIDQNRFTSDIADLINDGAISIEVKSGIDAVGREAEYNHALQWIAEIGQTVPGALEHIDAAGFIAWSAKSQGIPQEIVKTPEKYSEDQQAALQQKLNENLVDQIPKAGANIIEQTASAELRS